MSATPVANCSECPHRRDLLTQGRCTPGNVCVRAMSGRQIERFFRVNPALADDYAGDVFWERRAIAARYLSQQKLLPLIHDPDEVVRRVLAYRLPIEALDPLIADPDREVRVMVADRLPPDRLERLAADPDYLVRQYVARRLAVGRLFRMIRDPDRQVRSTVAERLPLESLGLLRNDPDPEVRIKVAERIRFEEANGLLYDRDWRVRLRLAERLPVGLLGALLDDADPDVRATAQARAAAGKAEDCPQMNANEPKAKTMTATDLDPNQTLALRVAEACAALPAGAGLPALVAAIGGLVPGLEVHHALTRGGWHRLGGVVDLDGGRIAEHLGAWAESISGGDIDELMRKVEDLRLFVTRLNGQTHYLVVPTGPAAQDFIQIEVEELQEVLDRCITDPDWFPDSIAEFVDPLDFPRLEPEPVGPSRLLFRRLVPVNVLLESTDAGPRLRRFLEDWDRSSAGETSTFCEHWVLSIREYRDQEGDDHLSAKPVFVGGAAPPALPGGEVARGAQLANQIHGFDRVLGYPFAWYFHMLTNPKVSHRLAEAVHADLMGAYDYLPVRDLKVLRDWYNQPYGA